VGSSLFLILAGEVAVVREARAGSPTRELARLRAGAFFGEMALLTNTPRTATVVAVRKSDFLEISRKSVRELIDREPRVLKLLMRFFRARLVGTLLQTSPLFKAFSRDERRQLISRFRLRELSVEQAVIREVSEETGLRVSGIRYVGSQPWPMPQSLMLGFRARAGGEQQIRVDEEEIAEAWWFSREELLAAVTGKDIMLPPPVSIAHRIIESWYGAPLPGSW